MFLFKSYTIPIRYILLCKEEYQIWRTDMNRQSNSNEDKQSQGSALEQTPREELEFIYKRKSIREFENQPVKKEDLIQMLQAATFAPSPKHQQNWHFVVVNNKELVDKMAEAVTKSHTQIASLTKSEEARKKYMNLLPYYINFQKAGCTVVVYANDYYMVEEKILRESNVDEQYIEELKRPQSCAQGIGAAVENFMLAASAMGYGTCYMTGPTTAKKELEELIGFQKPGYELMAMIAVGVPKEKTAPQPKRKPLEEVVTFIE